MKTQEFTVPGMTCGHCEASVREEVSEIAGVTGVEADRTRDYVAVTSDEGIDEAAIIAAIDEAGYSATPVK
ncbi:MULTISPECIES: heavy-metal-associated domain-containing protein [unclassified Corynebacterium]|uniref:heavy-metal-associated domain-containing protein n=1 Tax=unclassified Corynebacterium TaxID=2624378 RepID=UPI00309B0E56